MHVLKPILGTIATLAIVGILTACGGGSSSLTGAAKPDDRLSIDSIDSKEKLKPLV